ncbi:MAG TPA: metalloregulator ArsR/SmtB family transcription factor [Afifellaceae bacterium]|nr:metalloregulator ArsR/SmtB family transcription factor [Afifellaceae bacterium]
MTADVYHAISDPNRRRLLDLLSGQERSVQDLMPFFTVTVGAISQHLKVLLECGLVLRRKAGRHRLYRASPQALKEVHDWTAQFSAFWGPRLDRLGDYLDEAP